MRPVTPLAHDIERECMKGGVEMRAGRREEKEKESIDNTQILP